VKKLGFLLAGLAVCLLLAGVVSNFAAGSPDGLEHASREGCTFDENGEITGGSCMAQAERDHEFAGGPLADYQVRGLDGMLSTGLAGVAGVLITFAVGGGLFWLARRRRAPAPASAPDGEG
jgi:cobalt/nickel transport protein